MGRALISRRSRGGSDDGYVLSVYLSVYLKGMVAHRINFTRAYLFRAKHCYGCRICRSYHRTYAAAEGRSYGAGHKNVQRRAYRMHASYHVHAHAALRRRPWHVWRSADRSTGRVPVVAARLASSFNSCPCANGGGGGGGAVRHTGARCREGATGSRAYAAERTARAFTNSSEAGMGREYIAGPAGP